jgi:hypothetical protein
MRTTATLAMAVSAVAASLAWGQTPGPPPGQTPGQTGCRPPPGHTGPGQTGPGQTGPGQTGPGQTGPGQTGPGQTGCPTRRGRPGRPVVRRLRIAPRRFEALTGRRASIARRGGVRVSYVVSETGTARFTIERLERRGSAARLYRTTLRGSFRHGAVRGRNKLRFSGHLRGRALTPGRYNLVVRVVDLTGDRSAAKSTGFRVLRYAP